MKKEKTKIEDGKCKNKAESIAPWGGKIMKGCNQHIRGLVLLGNAIGQEVEARALPPTSDRCEFRDDLDDN